MRKMCSYLLGSSLIISSLFISEGCRKHAPHNNNIHNGNWTTSADFDGFARNRAVSFVIGSSAYIATGYGGDGYCKDLWQFNSGTGHWTQVADMPVDGRGGAAGFSIGAKGYVGTGKNFSFYQ